MFMITARSLAIILILEHALPSVAIAKDGHERTVTIRDTRSALRVRSSMVARQDLFDRRNPNNFRVDWPSPPAQPGQF
ncbi:hypothetical protein [Bradyrhizobium sp. RT3b]|uniref:hypothetical protein n=2 Tax=Bradyrhizobium TaxID=374 RepID=UPI00339A5756